MKIAVSRAPGAERVVTPIELFFDLDHTDVSAEHLLERFRLFFLIALGETVLTTGAAFVNEPFEVERLLTLAVSFAGTVALWWC